MKVPGFWGFYYLSYTPIISISFLQILQVQSERLVGGVSISYAFVILYIWLNVTCIFGICSILKGKVESIFFMGWPNFFCYFVGVEGNYTCSFELAWLLFPIFILLNSIIPSVLKPVFISSNVQRNILKLFNTNLLFVHSTVERYRFFIFMLWYAVSTIFSACFSFLSPHGPEDSIWAFTINLEERIDGMPYFPRITFIV